MKNDPFVAEPFGPVANIGRRLREIFGETYGELDERMLDLLHELDFIPSARLRPAVCDGPDRHGPTTPVREEAA